MDVVYYSYPVDTLLYMYLGATAVFSFIIGLVVRRVSRRPDISFWTTIVLSFVGLCLSLGWFRNASVTVFMGTLPWLINLVFSLFLYALYSGIIYFIFRPRKIEATK
ncbi:putative membrane protein [Exiguobacterium sp. S17]|nr:putative membrane protein [Exiguobacterium sp. S17]